MPKELSPEKQAKADAIAVKILNHSRNMLIMDLRFMEKAVGLLTPIPYRGSISVNGRYLYYDSRYILTSFKLSDRSIVRSYLHMVLHCVFRHFIVSPAVNRRYWNLACDIAAEVMAGELGYTDPDQRRAANHSVEIGKLRSSMKYLTAEKIYEYLQNDPPSENRLLALEELFGEDDHSIWYMRGKKPDRSDERGNGSDGGEDDKSSMRIKVEGGSDSGDSDGGEDSESSNSLTERYDELDDDELDEQWKSISQRMQTDLETLSKIRGKGAGNLYNFYCYGLEQYGNAAIIEPLEYSDVKRVREFVIAIDTSGSVQGQTVQTFLQKTYNILKQQESFFSKVNIHIIQCDATVQEDAKITSTDEFEEYMKTLQLRGFGGTDFRPVFRYVGRMIENGEFEDLRGLIYFTDGCGTYPEQQPPYNTAFVFIDDEYNDYNVPVWAMKLILETEDITDVR